MLLGLTLDVDHKVPVCGLEVIKGTGAFHLGQSPSLVSYTEMQVLVKAECRAGMKAVRHGQRAERLSGRLYWTKCG